MVIVKHTTIYPTIIIVPKSRPRNRSEFILRIVKFVHSRTNKGNPRVNSKEKATMSIRRDLELITTEKSAWK